MNRNQKTPIAARSCDLIGEPLKEEKVPAAWRRQYHRLLRLRKNLLNDAGELEQDARDETPSFSMHMADAATDSFDRDLALSLLASEQNALGEIDDALQRIRDGTYGVCEKTGTLISPERLDAIPWARCIVEAQAKMENQGHAPHAHLNRVESVRPEKLNPPQ